MQADVYEALVKSEMENAIARQRGQLDSQSVALAEWHRKADEDAGRLKRYYEALFEIAHGFSGPGHPLQSNEVWGYREALASVRARARRELADTVCPREFRHGMTCPCGREFDEGEDLRHHMAECESVV